MQIIQKEDGFDLSDEGQQAKQLENKILVNQITKNLTHKERKICELIEIGMSQRQICEEMGISHHTIRATLDKLSDIISNENKNGVS